MINPFKYVQQVRNEVSKIVWPTKKETMTTTIMVSWNISGKDLYKEKKRINSVKYF